MQDLQKLADKILDTADAIRWEQTKGSGKGGQRKNKVETKAVLYFDIHKSQLLNEKHKQKLLTTLKVNKAGVLQIAYGRRRLLTHNQQKCREIFAQALITALTPQKKRNTTIPRSVHKRIQTNKEKNKKHQSEKKKHRYRGKADFPNID